MKIKAIYNIDHECNASCSSSCSVAASKGPVLIVGFIRKQFGGTHAVFINKRLKIQTAHIGMFDVKEESIIRNFHEMNYLTE